jgi:hypothetical protein
MWRWILFLVIADLIFFIRVRQSASGLRCARRYQTRALLVG